MATLNVDNLTMLDIHQKVKATGDPDTDISLNDSDIRNIAAPDASHADIYHGAGINTNSGEIISMGEFRNGEHTSLDSFFNLSSWNTFQTDSVANSSFATAQAFCQMAFKNDTSNSRIECVYYAGDTSAMALTYTSYINYTGFTGNINVKYTTDPSQNNGLVYARVNSGDYTYQPHGWPGNTQNTAVSGSMPYTNSRSRKTSGTDYLIPTSGYVPFKWFVEGPGWTSGGTPNSGFDSVDHSMSFTVSFTSDNVPYSSTSAGKFIQLYAGRGPLML